MSYINNPKFNEVYVDTIGVDIDTKSPYKNIFVEINAKNMGKVIKYETQKGYHYRIHLKQKITIIEAFKLRAYLGDDQYRLLIDSMRLNSGLSIFDVLFTQKRKLQNKKP
ncbi:MAG: hypothetical protein QXV17_06845 [Candidatus Micrarchaeaceae archaeon]